MRLFRWRNPIQIAKPSRRAGFVLACVPLESRITPDADKARLISPVLSVDPTAYSATEIVAQIQSTQPIQDLSNITNYLGLGSSVDVAGSQIIFSNAGLSFISIRLKSGANPLAVTAALSPMTSLFSWVKPNYVYSPAVGSQPGWLERIPNDPAFGQQWHLPAVNAPLAWDTTFGNSGIIVGVIDGGIDISHPDLAANIYRNPNELVNDGIDNDGNGFIDDIAGWDFSNNTNNPNPDNPLLDTHGTQVAGVLAAKIDNSLGVAGLAGRVKILPLKVVGNGALTSISLARAAAYAVQQGVKIITCSINIDPLVGDPSFEATANFVYNRGVLWVNSAGNSNASNPLRQGFEQFYIVSATNRTNGKASYSNYGTGIDITAPGGEFGDGLLTTTTIAAGGYTTAIGTSLAAPLVAAEAALIWSSHPTFTRDQVASQISITSLDLNPFNSAYVDKLGSGLIDAGKAVNGTGVTKLGQLTGLPAAGIPAIGQLGTLTLHLKAPLDPTTVVPSNFELRGAGADNQFNTSDDVLIPVSIANTSPIRIGTNDLYFTTTQPLGDGLYRFTAKSGGLKDPLGQAIDGDNNGSVGGDYVREFGRSLSYVGTVYDDVDDSGDFTPGEPPVDDRDVFVDLNGNGIRDVQTGSSDQEMAIADDPNSTTRSIIVISGLLHPIQDVRVSVTIQHRQPGDLIISLVSPMGTRINLLANRFIQPYTTGDTLTLVFDDMAGLLGLDGTTFRPDDPLATFRGENGNGAWTLELTDTTPGDSGRLVGWSLSVSDEFTARTDSGGHFTLPDTIPNGNYVLLVALEPVETISHPQTILFGLGQNKLPIELRIQNPNAVTGKVQTSNGTPIAGAIIYDDANGNGRADSSERRAVSNAGGFYSVTGLSFGTHTLRVQLPLGYDLMKPPGGAFTVTLTTNAPGSVGHDLIASARPAPALPSIAGVSPDVRNSSINDVELTFNQSVVGLSKADFKLFRGSTPIPLDGVTLIGENGSYRLIGLANLTSIEGQYRLTVTTPTASGNPPSSSAFWTVDLTPPTVQTLRTTQNGPGQPAQSAMIGFNESVTGLTIANLTLSRNGQPVSLTGSSLTVANSVYTLGNLASLTNIPGQYILTVNSGPTTIIDTAGISFSSTISTTFNVTDPNDRPPVQDRIVVSTDAGRLTQINVLNTVGTTLFTLMPFGSNFTGGARTTTADVNNDSIADIIVASGSGRVPEVRVYDGRNGLLLSSFMAFETSFTGGVNIAAADFDGDGVKEIIVAPDLGGGPRVRVLSANGLIVKADFFGIEDPAFRGGARATAGDLNGDGRMDLIVSAGFGGGPRIAAYDGTTLAPNGRPTKLFNDFFAFEQSLRNGVYLAAGDVNNDGFDDLIAGGGPGGGPRVLAFSGKDLTQTGAQTTVANFFGGNPNNRLGATLAAKDLDGDGRLDLLVTDGPTVRGYLMTAIQANPSVPAVERQFNPFGNSGGVFVG